jgi:hypothetical protein
MGRKEKAKQMFLRIAGIYLGLAIGWCLKEGRIIEVWAGIILVVGVCIGYEMSDAKRRNRGGHDEKTDDAQKKD